jgi:hypothetical protein
MSSTRTESCWGQQLRPALDRLESEGLVIVGISSSVDLVNVTFRPSFDGGDDRQNRLALGDGQWLLVTGAAGALGGQLAALRGLRTIAVASPGDAALVQELGADEFSPVPTISAPLCAASFRVVSMAPLTPPLSGSQHLTRFATAARL